jgi:hypothetical protein
MKTRTRDVLASPAAPGRVAGALRSFAVRRGGERRDVDVRLQAPEE